MDKPIKKLTSFKKLPKAADPAIPQLPPELSVPGLMRPGTVLTETEQEGLKKLGIVQDTSKLPVNIAEKISEVMATEPALTVPSKPLSIPEPVDFENLPEEKKKDIISFIKDAADFKKTVAQKQAEEKPINPNLFKEPEVIDDLYTRKKEESPPPPVTPDKQPDYSGLESQDTLVVCPHCGWDTRNRELVEITEDDKLHFVQSILGAIRFKKSYELFGGALKITFRALSTAESDMAYKQLIVDAQDDIQTKVLSDSSFYWRTLMAYRSVMAIERIESEKNILEIPEISEIEVDPKAYSKPNTKLFALFDDLVEQIMPTEALRHAITHIFVEFQSLCDKLQAMAEAKDFWKAVK